MEKPGIDLKKIHNRMSDIQNSVAELRELVSQPPAVFLGDKRNVYAAAHLFLIALEAVASICNHLLSRLGQRAPGSYSECFESLGRLEILPVELTSKLIPLARFRNFLVHRYWEFDNHQIYEYTKSHIPVFEEFLRELTRWLNNQGLR